MVTGGLAAPLVYATKKALEFEDKMADVAKVTNTPVGSAEFKAMGGQVQNLAVYLGRTQTEAADLYSTLAQGGVLVKDLAGVAKIAGEVGVAFGVTDEEAGKALARMRNVLNLDTRQAGLVLDAVNELSNTRNATGGEILNFMQAGGASVANMMGFSGQDMAAFGATLRATIVPSAEEAATVMERMSKSIIKSPSLNKTFKDAGRGAKGFLAVLNKGLKAKDPNLFFTGFGEKSPAIMELARNLNGPKGLANALRTVADETKYAGSAQREFESKMSTGMASLRRLRAESEATATKVGEQMAPALSQAAKDVLPMAKNFGLWIEQNPETTKSILLMVGGLVALSATITAASFVVGSISTVIGAFATILGPFVVGGTLYGGVTAFFTGIAGTAGLAVAPFLALAGAIGYLGYKMSQDEDYLFKGSTRLFTGVKAFAKNIGAGYNALSAGKMDEFWKISRMADLQADQESAKIWGKGSKYDGYNEYQAWQTHGETLGGFAGEILSPSRRPTMPEPRPLPLSIAAPTQANQPSSFSFSPTYTINGAAPDMIMDALNVQAHKSRAEFEKFMKDYESERARRGLK